MNNPIPPGGASTLKITTPSLLLLIVAVSIVMLGRTQKSAISAPTTVARAYQSGGLLQTCKESATLPIPDPRAIKIKADEALEVLNGRAIRAFPNGEASKLFADMAGGKAEEDVLKMYYDISALPLKKRRALFRRASPNDKSDLWRTHLALFLFNRPNLNEWQKEVIWSAMSLATPDYFGVRSSDPDWKAKVREPSRSLEDQIVNAFSLEDATKIFAMLGDDADLANSSAPVWLKSINYKPLSDSGPYKPWMHNRFARQDYDLERGACGCSTESDYCPMWSSCGGGNCDTTGDGCGTLWSYPCNGACR